jgi:hypothetical protein
VAHRWYHDSELGHDSTPRTASLFVLSQLADVQSFVASSEEVGIRSRPLLAAFELFEREISGRSSFLERCSLATDGLFVGDVRADEEVSRTCR